MERPDAVERDAEPQPPDRPLRQIVEPAGTGERQAVVTSGCARQTMWGKQSAERLKPTNLLGRFKGLAGKQVTWRLVGGCQRVTASAVTELELTLEVGTPKIVWQ
jgi:hypothetical protein